MATLMVRADSPGHYALRLAEPFSSFPFLSLLLSPPLPTNDFSDFSYTFKTIDRYVSRSFEKNKVNSKIIHRALRDLVTLPTRYKIQVGTWP